MEHNLLQNGALNIYENYFDDMIPSELVKSRSTRYKNSLSTYYIINKRDWNYTYENNYDKNIFGELC